MFTLSSSLQYMAFSKPDDVGSAGNGKIERCLMKYAVVPITMSNNRSPTTTPITAKRTRGFAGKRNIKKTMTIGLVQIIENARYSHTAMFCS